MIIDSHVHIFPRIDGYGPKGRTKSSTYGRIDQGDGNPAWVLPVVCEETCHTGEMLLANMDRYGVDKAVLLQGYCYGGWDSYVLEAVRLHPDRLIGAAVFDPWSQGAREHYERDIARIPLPILKLEFSESSGLCGVYPNARLYSEDMRWLYDDLEERGRVLVMDLGQPGTRSYQTEAVRAIAIDHPGLTIVICHMGQLSPKVEASPALYQAWEEQLSLGKLKNVYFDASAVPFQVQETDEYPWPTAQSYVRKALEYLGPEKLMFGSDIPWLYCLGTYGQLIEFGRKCTAELSDEERDWFFNKTAQKVYWRDMT